MARALRWHSARRRWWRLAPELRYLFRLPHGAPMHGTATPVIEETRQRGAARYRTWAIFSSSYVVLLRIDMRDQCSCRAAKTEPEVWRRRLSYWGYFGTW